MPHRFAQTNIQLYNQMLSSGYAEREVRRVADAYELATEAFVGRYRGSGKTLIAHLVGTASIVAWCGRASGTVAAALLHAAADNGDFGSEEWRPIVARRAGADVADLIDAYHSLGWSYDSAMVDDLIAGIDTATDLERDVVLLRIANELEDYLDLATHYHGSPGDGATERKSAPWRMLYLDEVEEPLCRLAVALGEEELASELSERFSEVRASSVPVSLRSGHTQMWFRVPASHRRVERSFASKVAYVVRNEGISGLLGRARDKLLQ